MRRLSCCARGDVRSGSTSLTSGDLPRVCRWGSEVLHSIGSRRPPMQDERGRFSALLWYRPCIAQRASSFLPGSGEVAYATNTARYRLLPMPIITRVRRYVSRMRGGSRDGADPVNPVHENLWSRWRGAERHVIDVAGAMRRLIVPVPRAGNATVDRTSCTTCGAAAALTMIPYLPVKPNVREVLVEEMAAANLPAFHIGTHRQDSIPPCDG